MLRIDDTIFSLDILDKKFSCHLPKCLGNCCRYGDSGAPLTQNEADILKEIWPEVKPFLTPEGIREIEEHGTSILDFEKELVTPLIEKKECAYTIMEGNIFLCGIEKSWMEGRIKFQKPLSCHLYPVRIKKFTDFIAVNYDQQPVCAAARRKGQDDGIYVYEFLKAPLVRAVGEKMYKDLCVAANELRKRKAPKT